MKKLLITATIAASLTGCASFNPIPEGYTGPTATIADSGQAESASKAQLFALTSIDGHLIMNSFLDSSNASRGMGDRLTVVLSKRMVPAKPMKATLKASHETGAPIHAIADKIAGTFFSVEGTVDFTPKANGHYVVRGELKKEGSSVWIEDADTGLPITGKITGK